MRQVLIELCDLLNNQKDILNKLLELSLEEQQILIKGQSDKLEAVVRLELKELSKLGACERKRVKLCETIATELGLQSEDITISKIAENVTNEEKEVLVKLQTELLSLAGKHTELNSQNRELVNSHMEYSNAIIELMTEPDDPLNNFYGDDGRETSNRKKSTGFYSGHA